VAEDCSALKAVGGQNINYLLMASRQLTKRGDFYIFSISCQNTIAKANKIFFPTNTWHVQSVGKEITGFHREKIHTNTHSHTSESLLPL
jgi:hypothetical protein